MSPPEETKLRLHTQDVLPQYNLLMKQIVSYMGEGGNGLQREWKTRCHTLLERNIIIFVK